MTTHSKDSQDWHYSAIAEDYYDASLHKTSRNFDEAARAVLSSWQRFVPPAGLVLDAGCGRGRCNEFLGVSKERVVQLDSSSAMLAVSPREPAILHVLHSAEVLPFRDGDFSVVSAFLCDPFLGLEFLGESFRVLGSGGLLVGTAPAQSWGRVLRKLRGVDERLTRFKRRDGSILELPSNLVSKNRLLEMLDRVGFDLKKCEVIELPLAPGRLPISVDISEVAQALGLPSEQLPIVVAFRATK